jgi:hypothetical protein
VEKGTRNPRACSIFFVDVFHNTAQIGRNKKKAFRAIHAKGFLFSAGDARLERATFGSGGLKHTISQTGIITHLS